MEFLITRAALSFGLLVSFWFLVFLIYTPMSGSAPFCLAVFFRCFRKHHTLLQSRHCNLHPTHQCNKAPFPPWPLLHFLFLHLFRKFLLTNGKWDFFVVLICISGLLGWPKRAYAFFSEFIQEKMHTPFLAKGILVDVWPLFMCFSGDSILTPEICFLQFCLSFQSFSLPVSISVSTSRPWVPLSISSTKCTQSLPCASYHPRLWVYKGEKTQPLLSRSLCPSGGLKDPCKHT